MSDVIVALATAWGRSAIAVVRLSGSDVIQVLYSLTNRKRFVPRRATFVYLHDSDGVFDEGLCTFMPGPRSYTGEDTAEISCHGNPLLVQRLISACVENGARLADPGEFTRRSCLNGRMDLTRAEAVLQAIEANSKVGLEIARKAIDGDLERFTFEISSNLLEIAAELEAHLDFPDQLAIAGAMEIASERDLAIRLENCSLKCQQLADTYKRGHVMVSGAKVALVGPVNAGKSSLLNALLGKKRALVDSVSGTTRDVLEVRAEILGVPVVLMDTAGEHEFASKLELEGLELRDELISQVDLLIVVIPAHNPKQADPILAWSQHRPRILVGNHADKVNQITNNEMIMTSAIDGRGIDLLKREIVDALVGEQPGEASLAIASERQRDLLLATARFCRNAIDALLGQDGVVVASEEILEALTRLSEISGANVRENVLDALFSRFCVGK